MTEVIAAADAYVEALTRRGAEVVELLAAGVDEQRLADQESSWGLELPDQLRELYRWHDGIDLTRKGIPARFGYFMPAGFLYPLGRAHEPIIWPDTAVASTTRALSPLLILCGEKSLHLVVSLEPSHLGQVWLLDAYAVEEERVVTKVADDLAGCFRLHLDLLEAGWFVVEDGALVSPEVAGDKTPPPGVDSRVLGLEVWPVS